MILRIPLRLVVLAVTLLALPSSLFADPIKIDFESLTELDSVSTQFLGLTFSNAAVLTAGSSLNEIELPPHSGLNAVFDDGGAASSWRKSLAPIAVGCGA